jgi:hypothetical protein
VNQETVEKTLEALQQELRELRKEKPKGQFQVTWISVGIGFVIQCMALGWFAADLTSGIKRNNELIQGIRAEQQRRTDRVYTIDRIKDDISRMREDLKEVKRTCCRRP